MEGSEADILLFRSESLQLQPGLGGGRRPKRAQDARRLKTLLFHSY